MYCHSSKIRNAITKGYDKLKTYYIKTDDSKVYPIATSKSQHFKFIYLNFVLNLFNYFSFSYFFPLLISVLELQCSLPQNLAAGAAYLWLTTPGHKFFWPISNILLVEYPIICSWIFLAKYTIIQKKCSQLKCPAANNFLPILLYQKNT